MSDKTELEKLREERDSLKKRVNDSLKLKKKEKEKARKEVIRIQQVLDNLGPGFAEDGIVKTVLRERIEQERRKAEKK